MWVNGLMEQTAPSFVGGGVRPGPVAWLWAPHTASLGVCLICSMRPLVSNDDDDPIKQPIEFYPKD